MEDEIRRFPEKQDRLRNLQLYLAAEERGHDTAIEDFEKDFNALLEQLANCCCPKDKKTTEGPDVPGLEEEVGMTPFKPNQAVGLFSVIREDSDPERFNTYGFDASYTRYLNERVGLTVDFSANFRERGGVELSKYALTGGVTVQPFNDANADDPVRVFVRGLAGVSHFQVGFTDTSFTAKLGGGVDVNVNNNFFISPIQVHYAPTWFGGKAQHNVQVGFGAGVRWK